MFDARAHPGSGPVRLTAAPERPNCSPPRRTSRRPLPPPAPRRPPAVSKRSQQQRNPSGSEIGDRRSRYGREAAPAPQHPRTRRARHRAAHAAPRTQRFACAFSGTHLRTRCLRLLVTRATGAGYAGSQSSPFPAVKPPEEIEEERSRLEERKEARSRRSENGPLARTSQHPRNGCCREAPRRTRTAARRTERDGDRRMRRAERRRRPRSASARVPLPAAPNGRGRRSADRPRGGARDRGNTYHRAAETQTSAVHLCEPL
eukprot:XP_025000945.1 serine/arginine repetitive matrix protein 1-like [Gallus gallus]